MASSSPNSLLPSEFDGNKLDSLIAWLKTFPQFDGLIDESVDSIELLAVAPVAKNVLRITEEILALPPSDALDNVESIWGQVFAALTTPKLLQKIAGRPLGSGELRFVLLSCLLSTSVGEGCTQRITYINRIMGLSKDMQHALMTLIEAFPKTPRKSTGRAKTPTKSPGRTRIPGKSPGRTTTPGKYPGRLTRTPVSIHRQQEVETPQSSGSCRDLDSSFASVSRNSTPARPRRSFSARLQTEPKSILSTKNDLLALMGWIRAFPQMAGLGPMAHAEVLEDMKVSLAILHVAEHLCGQQPSPPAYTTVEDIWAAVYNVLVLVAPSSAKQCVTPSMSLDERQTRQTALLSVLLKYAVSDGCRDRKTHIEMILSLPLDIQQRLTTVVDQNRSFQSKTPLRSQMNDVDEVASIGSTRSRDDVMTSPSGLTPARKRRSFVDRNSTEELFSPGTLDPAFERMVDGLKSKNQSLHQELANSAMREAELAVKMQELETKVRKNTMKIEAESLRTSDEAHEAHQKELAALREELYLLQDVRDKEQKSHRELINIRDEMDLMEHSKEFLAETVEKLRKCRERLEQLADVKDSLKREEEAHSSSVEECLRLENEVKSLQPLRRQLEEYKERAVEAEFQLVECQEDLKRMTDMIRHLNSTHDDLIGESRSFQEETETLRKKLSKDEEIDCDGPAVGEGISELNPQIKEELLRLRNENAQLKEFAAKRGTDSVQRLEEKLDDIQRLSDRFKEQYLSTKKELESTSIELEETQEREEDLKEEVVECIARLEDMNKQAKMLQEELDQTKEDLEKTITLLEESKQREERLQNEVADVSNQKEEIQAESEERLVEWNKTKDELAGTLELLGNSQDREKNLHCELEEMEGKMQEEQQRSAAFENELNVTSHEFETTKTKLNATIDRENGLSGELADLKEVKDNLGKELVDEKQAREGDRVTAEHTLNETQERLEGLAKNELEGLQTNMNLLLEDERVAFRKKLDKAAGEYQELHDKTTREYAELKSKMTNGLDAAKADFEARITHLKNEYTGEIESIKKQAEQDREKLLVKGKGMLKDTKGKAEDIIHQLEDELDDTKQTLSQLRKDADEFEHKTRAKCSSYKHKLHYSTVRVNELGDENEQLSDFIRGLEKEKSKVLEENERYRRQLGGRYGADGKTQNQMDMLQKEFNAVLEENRTLKKKLASSGSVGTLGAITEGREADFGEAAGKPYARGGVSGSTLSALREEYEEQIQGLNDEKRELVMKNSAAITDVQKAEQRSWELEKDLEKLKEEVTSAHLALQRAELQMEDSRMETSAINEQSFHSAKEEDFLSGSSDEVDQENAAPLLDLSVLAPSPPATPQSVLSPSNRPNVSSVKRSVTFGGGTTKSTPAEVLNASMSSEGPTLMELTQQNANAQDGQPECKQS